LVRYYDDETRYADLINGFVFGGRQVVSGEDVTEMDSRKTGRKDRSRTSKKEYRQRYRDFVRKTVFGINCVIIALENQKKISYAMPVRVMDGDAMEYSKQLNIVRRRNKRKKDLEGGEEFLELFAKDDRIPATFSLVVYYGEKPWDGARDLYELLDLKGIPEELRKLVNHYPIHVLEVRRFEHTEWFQTDLREVFEFIQCMNDKEKMERLVKDKYETFSNLDEDACDVIASVGKMKEINFKDEKYRNEKGGVNMSKALQDWGEELREEGRVAGYACGHETGYVSGHMQGCQETERKHTFALFNDGMSVERVVQLFGLDSARVAQWHDEWMTFS